MTGFRPELPKRLGKHRLVCFHHQAFTLAHQQKTTPRRGGVVRLAASAMRVSRSLPAGAGPPAIAPCRPGSPAPPRRPPPRPAAPKTVMIDATYLKAHCLIPWFDGVILSQDWKEALWDKFVTAAPRPRTPSELQYSDRRRAGMGSGLFMHFSGELELHDGIGRADSVGNVLQHRQILRPHRASATEPVRAPAGRTAQCGALRGSLPRGRADRGGEWDRDRTS